MWKNTGTNATATGEFTDGIPSLGQPRSILGATVLNMILRELQNAVLDSGQALNAADEHQLAKAIRLMSYPVGSVYTCDNDVFNPNVAFGGTWSLFSPGRTLVGQDISQVEFDTLLETGGAKTHTLTTAQGAPHGHRVYGVTGTDTSVDAEGLGNTGGPGLIGSVEESRSYLTNNGAATPIIEPTGAADPHNNLQPYTVVRYWRRTA